jgi:hypothetical protein
VAGNGQQQSDTHTGGLAWCTSYHKASSGTPLPWWFPPADNPTPSCPQLHALYYVVRVAPLPLTSWMRLKDTPLRW